jgi:peptide/nickel transport system substrate-binding protein
MEFLSRLSRLSAALLLSAGTWAASAAARDLTIALPGNVNTLDPDKTNTVGTDLSVIAHLYTPLVDRGPDLALRPGLATRWEALDDTTWRFTLREGVTFPNGEKLDAEAVKWNVARVLDPRTAARNRPWFANIEEVRVVSPTVVEFRTKTPYPDLPPQMGMFFLMPPQWTEANNPNITALGTGPYELERFASGDRVVLKARAGYWGEKPAFDRVTFRIMPEDSARIAAVLAGDIDFATALPASELERINRSRDVRAASTPSTRVMFLKLNAMKPPFKDNPKLWRALNLAVDKQGINQALLSGMGQLAACQPLSPAYFGFNPDLKPLPYDPAQARKLLSEAGFPRGLSFDLEVPTGRYLGSQDISQVLAAQFAEIGVTANLREMEFGSWMSKYINQKNLGDSAYFGLAWPTLDAGGLLNFWEEGNFQAYWQDADYNRLALAARSTTDAAKREALYRQLTQKMCDASPNIFLFFPPITYAERGGIQWHARGDDWVRASDFSIR